MNNIEKIRGLLEKRALSEEEKRHLANILDSDPEAKEYYEKYARISDTVRINSHPTSDEIGSYVLYLNTGESEDGTVRNIQRIEDHLRKCGKCQEEFKLLNEEFSEIDSYVSSSPKEESTSQAVSVSKGLPRIYYAFALSAFIAVVYSVLYLVSYNLSSPYYQQASLKSSDEFYVTRGRASDYFQESIQALDERDYEEAIVLLKKDIEENKDEESIFYSHYILGLTYLETAPKSFIGLFPRFDGEKVKEGIKNLNAAVSLNRSGRFDNISLDSYFYLGKANLMLENKSEAIKYFTLVIEQKGSKMNEAREIIEELE